MSNNMVFNCFKNSAILTLVFSFSFLQADPVDKETAYNALISYKHRPSIQDVVHEFGGEIPPPGITKIKRGNWATSLTQSMPRAIALLEYMYPGGIWAGLGRDAVAGVDILEAFYLGIGQPGRVARINASSSSFNSKPELFVQMLKDVGMDIDHFETMRPFIMFDYTGYSSGSQSTRLTMMVYSYFIKKYNLPIENLFEKFAMTSTSAGQPETNRENFFKNLAMASKGQSYPVKLLHVPISRELMYQTEWHPSFGDLVPYPNGQIGGEILGQSAHEVKRGILDIMLEGYYAVQTFEFLEAVRAEAKKLGYDFDQHVKTYSKDWVPPKFVPREPYMEELTERSALAYFSMPLQKETALENLITHLTNTYAAEISSEMYKSMDALNQFKAEKGLDDKQFTEHKKALIDMGFKKLDQSIRQKGEELKIPLTHYEYLMIALLKTFSKYEPYEKTYYSANAKQIRDMFASTVAADSIVTPSVLSYLRLLEVALNDELISSKDYRRLILHALSFVANDKNFYAALPQLFIESPKLQSYLIKHAKVYLTSKKNSGAGQKAYLEMINQKLLPKPSECDVWLSGKDEDKGNEKKAG